MELLHYLFSPLDVLLIYLLSDAVTYYRQRAAVS